LRVAQFLANLWQGACTAVHGMDAGAIVRSPAHSRLVPQVQCCRVLDLDGTRGGQWDYGRCGVRGRLGTGVLMRV
jgi:hypothetical protein